MSTDRAIVCRIRPMSWKVFVQGEAGVQYVRGFLSGMRIECSQAVREPELHDPPIFSIVATLNPESPLTAHELESLLATDEGIEVAFETTPAAGRSGSN